MTHLPSQKALSCLPLGERILSLSFSYGHTLSDLAQNPEIFLFFELVQYAISHILHL